MKAILGNFMLFSLLNAVSFNAYSQWECYAGDKGGHFWMSTGLTEERAGLVALNFCEAYSPYPGTCHQSKCFER